MQDPGAFGRGRKDPNLMGKWRGNAARLALIGLFFAAVLQPSGPAHAEIVSVTGSAGADGLDGTPGATGGSGLPGEPATAVATLDAVNEATATGGSGGDAGDGGNATDASNPAGDGGDGGAGGNAYATSSADEIGSSVSVVSESVAIGGSGGDAGAGGSNGDGASGAGGTGGAGGDANTFVSATATATSPQTGPLQSTSIGVAIGGNGGSGEVGGRGGDASGVLSATVAGDTSLFLADSTSSGGRGGNSISNGGGGGDGGRASSDVVASGSISTGSISSESFGGQGGLGGSNLGLDGAGGDGGEASSTADFSIEGVVLPNVFNEITIEALSEGGDGGWGWGEGFNAGSGGAASASASSMGASTRTTVRATSRGGDGGLGLRGASAGDGGSATVSSVSGSTTNGASLTIEARAEAGNGGGIATNNDPGPLPAAANGGDATIIDGVEGTTTGFLRLNQFVVAGNGGDGTVDAGDGGNALSALTREVDNGSVSVLSQAVAGVGGNTTRGVAGRGGDAEASASIVSIAGAATVNVYAVGGQSGGTSDDPDATAAAAGNAVTDVYAETRGDGNFVSIGSSRATGAVGGDAGNVTISLGNTFAHGGSATSRSVGVAKGDSLVRVFDVAKGGRGAGGGNGFDPGQAGDGGDASSYAEGSNAGSELVFVEANATGGQAGGLGNEASEGGRGGGAEAIARGSSSGGGDVLVTARQRGGSSASIGSVPQPTGADTRMEDAVSGSTSGIATLRQYASGGDGGLQGVGGSATSILNARNEGGGVLEAIADATGGDGSGNAEAEIIVSDSSGADIFGTAVARGGDAEGIDQAGGVAFARGHGSSSAGGNVTVAVEQYGGDGSSGGAGANSDLVDAVSGETTGTLTLMQTAEGGLGGLGFNGSAPGQSGDAMSEIDATNPAGGALVVVSSAIGGRGARSSGTSPSAPGGNATASGRAIDHVGSDVELRVLAQGGDANRFSSFGESGDGGEAFLGRIYASSAGGAVSVEGTAIGGSAVQQQNQAGRGASVMLSQAVDGDTIGRLTLIQNAIGGDGGGPATDTIPSGAGNASSYLDRTKSAEHLTLSVTAQAGGQRRTDQTEEHAVGGDADAQVSGVNDSGGVMLLARAIGGDFEAAIGVDGIARRGGHANVRATSTTVVDGADIQIGLPSSALFGAEGGTGATNSSRNPEARGGRGGEATSESIGIALGDSQVLVYDRAIGGQGARDDSFRVQFNGEGGDGTSYAEARTAGTSDAIAKSSARGGAAGQGSNDPDPGPAGGDASATAWAEGLGASRASATTFGGGSTQASTGEAISRASAVGGFSAYAETFGSGRTQVEAIAILRGPGPIAETKVTTFISARTSSVRASSHAFYDGREQSPGSRGTYADVRITGPLATAELLSAGVLAEIDLNLTGSERNNELIDNHALVEMILATPVSDASRQLFIDFDTDVDQEASFDSLHLLVSLGGAVLIDETFADVSSALLFFTTASNLLLGTQEFIGEGQIAILMSMESVSRTDRFSAQFSLTQVPEPNVALLLLAGLGVLGATKKRVRV